MGRGGIYGKKSALLILLRGRLAIGSLSLKKGERGYGLVSGF